MIKVWISELCRRVTSRRFTCKSQPPFYVQKISLTTMNRYWNDNNELIVHYWCSVFIYRHDHLDWFWNISTIPWGRHFGFDPHHTLGGKLTGTPLNLADSIFQLQLHYSQLHYFCFCPVVEIPTARKSQPHVSGLLNAYTALYCTFTNLLETNSLVPRRSLASLSARNLRRSLTREHLTNIENTPDF